MSRIAIFDSGVGGLSIYQEIVKKCPNSDYVFVSDNQAFPYGTKLESELEERVLSVVQSIEQRYKPDILVVACNTASTIALPSLRRKFDFHVVGVVPAIKPAAKLSASKVIGLLATPGTIARPYTQKLIDEFAQDCRVIKVGSSKLVQIAEQKMYGITPNANNIEKELTPFFQYEKLDNLVLACTHFPLLSTEIDHIFKANSHVLNLIDSGIAIANRVSELLIGCSDLEDRLINNKKAVFTKPLMPGSLNKHLTELGFTHIDLLT